MGSFFIVNFKGIDSRFKAEALSEQILEIDTSILPELPENEYYLFELVGMEALSINNEKIGTVKNVYDRGITVVEVEDSNGNLFEIPLTDDFFIKLDKKNRKIVLNKPEYEVVEK